MTSVRVRGDVARSSGFHLGDGLFETVLVASGRPCLLPDHLKRMRKSGAALGIAVPPDLDDWIVSEVPALWEEEGRPPRAALRISVSRGEWSGLDPVPGSAPVCVLALRRTADRAPDSLRAELVDCVRVDPRAPLVGHKVLSWMGFVEARREARARGADVGLLLTTECDVAEADCANVFVVRHGVVRTPPLRAGVFPGITRRRVLRSLRGGGHPVLEDVVTLADLVKADEAFLTSSLTGVVALSSVARHAYAPGPVTAWLRERVPPEGGRRSAPGR